MRVTRNLVPLAAVAALLLTGAALPGAADLLPEPHPRAAHSLVVTGFAVESLSARVVKRDAHALDMVSVAGLGLKADGSTVTLPDHDVRRVLGITHRHGLRAELIVSNWTARTGDFDSDLITSLLSSRAHRLAAVRRIVRIARQDGWDSINIDFEAMHARDRDGLVAFLRALRHRLPTRVELSMDMGARTSLRSYRQSGFSLGELRDAVDRIVLMTYDQHGAGWSGPGPIGSLPWQRRSVAVLAERVPLTMVDLGIAGYGYTWPTSGTGHSVSPRRARAMASTDGATPRWHPRDGEWSVTLSDGTEIWWSDARSYQKRLALAHELGVHGVALWRLGSADPLP
ncbi:MAG: glycosyl hydrolase family 18 protein [Nocardioidaceae bacterium]